MINFPEFLNFGNEIAQIIEKFFNWLNKSLSFFFNFIKDSIALSVDLTNEFLTKTPWWLWLIVITVFVVLSMIKFKKLYKWLIVSGIIALWLIVFNVYFENPANGFNQSSFQTPWVIYAVLIFFATKFLYNYKTAIMLSSLVILVGVLGVWDETILTLSIIIISVLLSLLLGIPLGIWMAKNNLVAKITKPILDLLQTIPTFVYLIPAVMLFGIGIVPGTIATLIYALPPIVRLTYLGITEVDSEIIEAGVSFGSTEMQLLTKIELPQALSTIAAGLNQTTMMAVSMVVTASMIGAGGLGAIVFDATQQNKIGQGFVGGFAIVALAIILDRLLQGIVMKIESKKGEVK